MEVKYYINEEKRTIVAVLVNKNTREIMYKVEDCDINIPINWLKEEDIPYILNTKYVGKAVCGYEDNWNVEIGKRIARRRAYQKYLKDRKNKYLKMVSTLDKRLNNFKRMSEKAEDIFENYDVYEI